MVPKRYTKIAGSWMRTAFPIEYGNVIGMTHPHMATYTKRVNNEGS